MPELVFIFTDFFSAMPEQARDALPRLPVLEMMLSRARCSCLPAGWRGWLAARIGDRAVRDLAPSAAAAAAWPAASLQDQAPAGYWLATPVHYFAGLDSVRLHPAGLLQLDDDEQRQLAAGFAQVFADSPWRLRTFGQRELLLRGPPLEASGADPAQFAGADPAAGLPRGADAATLRRLGAEIEMWLHEHPLNLERGRRGRLPVSALWLWGAQRPPPTDPGGPDPTRSSPFPPRLFGRDTYVEALWRLQGLVSEALPAALEAVPDELHRDSVFLYPTLGEAGLTSAFAQFERFWLSGALRALRAGNLSGLQLLLGARAYRLRRWNLAQFWSARTPWWESLS